MVKIVKSFLISILIITPAVDAISASTPASVPAQELVIVYTNSTNGNIDSCNCPGHPTGGLVRRTTVVKRAREQNPNVLVLDSGDLFPVDADALKIKYTLKMMAAIGYDAVGIGDQEFAMGLGYLRHAITEYQAALPFISSDLFIEIDKKLQPLAPSGSIIKDFNGFKVGVISIINEEAFKFYPADRIDGIEITDPVEQLKKDVAEIRAKADLIVVLSHCGYDFDAVLLDKVQDIDVIVGGHSQTLMKDPVIKGRTIIVQAGARGDNVGVLTLKIDDKKRINSWDDKLILLDKDVEDNPAARQMINEYNDEVKKSNNRILIKPDEF